MHPKTKLCWAKFTALTVLVVGASVVTPTASAEPAQDTATVGRAAEINSLRVTGRAPAGTLTDSELRDLRELARREGQKLADLQARYRDRAAFDSLTTELADQPTYVQAGYDLDARDEAEVWIRFTTKPSDAILDAIRSQLSYRVRIEYGAALGWGDLTEAMERLFLQTSGQPGVTDVAASIDSKNDSIAITYSGEDRSLPASNALAKVVSAAVASEVANLDRIQVMFTRSPDAANSATEATVRGGYSLSTDTQLACTSGIPMTKSGQKGISTAMHCPNGLRYGGINDTGIIQYRNAASTTSTGNHIDLQWHSTLAGNSTSASFYVGAGTTRSITGANNAVVNDYVCHYGLGTGFGCDYVYQLGACYTPEDLTFCGLAVLDSWITGGGDSGGPWFNGNNIKGVHSGRAVIGGALRSVYTPQTRIAENLNGSVLKA